MVWLGDLGEFFLNLQELGAMLYDHVIDTCVDTFWERLFFDEEFNRRLYLEGLGFKSYEVLSQEGDPSSGIQRTIEAESTIDAPAIVRKILGSTNYREEGVFDAAKRRWVTTIVPKKMRGRITIGGEMWAEPVGPFQCRRIYQSTVSVRIAGVGKAIARFIERSTEREQTRAARFFNQFIREKGWHERDPSDKTL